MKTHILLDIDGVFNIDHIGDNIEVVKHPYGRWYCKSDTLKALVKTFYQKKKNGTIIILFGFHRG